MGFGRYLGNWGASPATGAPRFRSGEGCVPAGDKLPALRRDPVLLVPPWQRPIDRQESAAGYPRSGRREKCVKVWTLPSCPLFLAFLTTQDWDGEACQ